MPLPIRARKLCNSAISSFIYCPSPIGEAFYIFYAVSEFFLWPSEYLFDSLGRKPRSKADELERTVLPVCFADQSDKCY